jgi:hypothetical protein
MSKELNLRYWSYNILSNSKDIALLIEVHGKDNYKPVVEFLNGYSFKIEFERSNENGDWKHIIARKSSFYRYQGCHLPYDSIFYTKKASLFYCVARSDDSDSFSWHFLKNKNY